MATNTEQFLTGDDLDDLFMLIDGGFLTDDEDLDRQVNSITTEISLDSNIATYSCSKCNKVCKSQRGLRRHINVRHTTPPDHSSSIQPLTPEEISAKKLHPLKLKTIVSLSAEKLAVDLCLPVQLRSKFSNDNFSFSVEEAQKLWHTLRSTIDKYSGDAEKFYSQFFTLLQENLLPSKFDHRSVTNALMAEVSTEILIHLSSSNAIKPETSQNLPLLSENELKSLQYLAGFVIHKLYVRFHFSKNNCDFNNICSMVLKACKIDNDETQTLIDAKDRGGLWKVNKKVQTIFKECELVFRSYTSTTSSSIVCENLVKSMITNCVVISNFTAITATVDLQLEKEFSLNLLEHILTLFVRVRTFSFAKDIREKHKKAKQKTKKRSLRTEIKKASSSCVEGH
jgi:hypothetical protein